MAATIINALLVIEFIDTKQTKKTTTNFLIFIMFINDALLSSVVLPLMVVALYDPENGTKCKSLFLDL